MRTWAATLVVWMAGSGLAAAQGARAADSFHGYVEAVAQSAFGNVTSQSYGGELGVAVAPAVKAFLDIGQVRDTSPSTLGPSAQAIAAFLTRTQGSVAFQARQPVTFGLAGIRYTLPLSTSHVELYVLGGGGIARVRRDVTFSVGGSDVTANLAQYGVVLGSDLAGSETDGMLTVGGGVAWPVWQRVVVDFQYRYGRVFAEGQGITVNRAGAGLGVRF